VPLIRALLDCVVRYKFIYVRMYVCNSRNIAGDLMFVAH